MSEPIPVIYILSSGRSGTTLLDMLLGGHPNIWTLGEAQILPWELKNRRAPCGCGEPIPEDSFWQPLLSQIPTETDGYHIGYFRNRDQAGRVLRWNVLFDLLRNPDHPRNQEAIEEYAENNERYFRTVREAARQRTNREIRWLVDNSKDPYRLYWLQQSEHFDLRVIHMIKDPRAFVYSMTKNRLPGGLNKVVRFTGRWIVEYLLMRYLTRSEFSDDRVRMVRYEDLASNPGEVLQPLVEWLDLDFNPELVEDFRQYENHAVSGNMMRWRESDTEIELDERWKQGLPLPYQYLVYGLTFPFLAFSAYTPPG